MTAKTALLLLIAVAGLLAVLLVSGQERRAAPEVADRPLARSTPPAPTNHKKPLLSVPRQVLARRPPAPVPMADRWLRVVDEDGHPIRDARVHSVPPKAHHVSREGRWTGRSDEAGRVALPGGMPDSAAGGMPGSVPRAGEVLLVRHPGYQPLTVEESLLRGAPGREVEVVLKSGYRVAGRVEDPWGKPIAGARVLARLPGAVAPESVLNALPGPGMAARYRETTADEQGRFAFGGLTSLPVSLAARKRYFICGLRPDQNVREPREDLLLVMEPQARVGIRALDAATRLPIAQFGARAAREARGRGYRPSVLELPREDVPATGLSRSGSEFWLTFCLTQAASTARGQSIPILVEAWGYRQTTVELPLSYPGDGDFTQPREVYLEPLPARDATGNVLFDISCPALGRGPGQVWISLASSLLDLPTMAGRPRDSRFKARSSRLLWLKDGRASVELPAGTYEAMLGGPLVPHPSDWKPFTVREDKTTNVQMSLPGSIVRIRAYGPGREVIPYFSVGANWKSGGAYRSHVTLQRGETLEEEARSYGVKPGELALPLAPRRDVLIHVLVPGYKVWTEMRHIEAGACLEIEAHLERDEQK